jgi:hypothetical protein
MANRTGEHFGNDRLVAQLGQGSFAEVQLGQYIRLSLQAARKVLQHPSWATRPSISPRKPRPSRS